MSWIQTHTGRRFDFDRFGPDDIATEDIAHSLSQQCRFTGHSRHFYSVAEHSVHVRRELLRPRAACWGLMHDAAEAYISDLNTPVKRRLWDYRTLEERILFVIAERFDLDWPIPAIVRKADLRLLVTEARTLLPLENSWLEQERYRGVVSLEITLPCWPPKTAKRAWLEHATALRLS